MKLLSRVTACAVTGVLMLGTSAASVRADSGSDSSSDSTLVPSTDSVAPPTTTTLPPVSGPQRGRTKIAVVRVILSEQRAYVFAPTHRLIATLPVSTGLLDTTPVGVFKVFSKSALAVFSPEPGEKMRWMTRFAKGPMGDNVGFHGIPFKVTKQGETPIPTPLGIAPASHGCVRLRVADAKWIFDNLPVGGVVRVDRTRN